MVIPWFDRLGDWNPQLFRELKGRLKLSHILVVAGLALFAQLILLFFFYSQLPLDELSSQHYCQKITNAYDCLTDAAGNILIDWERWWTDIFRVLNWALMLLAMTGGVFMLVNDLDQEERRGTLNFIRLSPQRGQSVLLGKLLGVPALLYLGLALIVPLHLIAAAGAEAPIQFVASFYILLIVSCGFLYSLALLGGFLGKLQANQVANQLGSGMTMIVLLFTVFVFIPTYIAWNQMTNWNEFTRYVTGDPGGTSSIEWFFMPLGKNWLLAHGFTLLNLGLATYGIWHSLQRSYHSPTSTVLSKGQSYGLVAYCELLMVGFCLQSWYEYNDGLLMGQAIAITLINLPLFLMLIAVLTPHRQTLLDWARYRHLDQQHRQQADSTRNRFSTSLLHDLIWGEKSPALVAIALNLGIMAAIFLPWMLTWPPEYSHLLVFLGFAMSLTLMAIYGALVQLALLMKSPRRSSFAAAILALAIVGPMILAGAMISGGRPVLGQFFALFSPILWGSFFNSSQIFPIGMVLLGFIGHIVILTTLTAQLSLQLQKAGESSTKSLLASTSHR